MAFRTLLPIPAMQRLLDSLLPDLFLSFTFFTALLYAVLSKRFGRNRSAAGMSVAMGLALSIGLVWWEHRHGYSIRDLGLPAVLFAVLVVCLSVFQSVRRLGGSWVGVDLAIAVAILAMWALGFGTADMAQTLAGALLLAIIVAMIALLGHANKNAGAVSAAPVPPPPSLGPMPESMEVEEDLRELKRDSGIAAGVWDRLRRLRRQSDHLQEHPGDVTAIVKQINRLLPAEGWLTERLARLRARAHRVREGHVARIKELRGLVHGLPAGTKRRASQELTARYHELRLDTRLERLDKAVAGNERRIRDLTRNAKQAAATHDFRHLTELLAKAEKLQGHNSTLLRKIESMEEKLIALVREVGAVIEKWRQEAANPVRVEVRRRNPPGAAAQTEVDARSAGVYYAVGNVLGKRLHAARHDATLLTSDQANPSMIMTRLEGAIPEEGWLTDQLARLRARVHRLRREHEARLAEANCLNRELDGPDRRRTGRMAKRRRQFIHIERRLERLDAAVAVAERKVRETTREAIEALRRGDAARLIQLLRVAEGLQAHANKLLKIIMRTEKKLSQMTAESEKCNKRGGEP